MTASSLKAIEPSSLLPVQDLPLVKIRGFFSGLRSSTGICTEGVVTYLEMPLWTFEPVGTVPGYGQHSFLYGSYPTRIR